MLLHCFKMMLRGGRKLGKEKINFLHVSQHEITVLGADIMLLRGNSSHIDLTA